ncbi:MAG: hypothetical protein AMXMBFR34_35030 [Myxococcaceae bacterium]
MKRYFKHEAESEFGIGWVYFEITNDWPSRQVEVYGQTWLWGDDAHPEHLADQPLQVLELGKEHEISVDAFERVWVEALERCQPHL